MEESGTLASFAARAGLSGGRLSQLVASLDPVVGPGVLETLLGAVSSPARREELYRAWIREFAPSPSARAPTERSDEDTIRAYLADALSLVALGRGRECRRALLRLWRALRLDRSRADLALCCGRSFVEVSCLLERRVQAATVAAEMAELSRRLGESGWEAVSLWLEATALRPLDPLGAPARGSPLERFGERLAVWGPRGEPGRSLRKELNETLSRDRLVAAWNRGRFRESDELIRSRLVGFRESLRDPTWTRDVLIAKEVEARALIVLGDLMGAREALATAQSALVPEFPIHAVKCGVTRIRLSVASMELDEAASELESLLESCEERGELHYRTELLALERRIWTLTGRTGRAGERGDARSS